MQPAQNRHLLVLDAAEAGLRLLLASVHEEENSGETTTLHLDPVCFQWWNAPSQGAEILIPTLENCLSTLGLKFSDISHIACVRGPGSFTGLRLALTTAAGLLRTTQAVAAGLDYLPLLALQAASLLPIVSPFAGHIWVITHARRNLVHLQGFKADGKNPASPVLALTLEEAAAYITLAGPGALIAGSGLGRNREFWEKAEPSLPEGTVFLPPDYNFPWESTLLAAAARLEYSKKDLEPLYVRGTDAEENLDKISAALGLKPETARERLRQLTSKAI